MDDEAKPRSESRDEFDSPRTVDESLADAAPTDPTEESRSGRIAGRAHRATLDRWNCFSIDNDFMEDIVCWWDAARVANNERDVRQCTR
jgi:hypothetical protein